MRLSRRSARGVSASCSAWASAQPAAPTYASCVRARRVRIAVADQVKKVLGTGSAHIGYGVRAHRLWLPGKKFWARGPRATHGYATVATGGLLAEFEPPIDQGTYVDLEFRNLGFGAHI